MEDRRLIDNFNLKLQNTYIRLPDKFYTKQYPEEVPNPMLVAFNDSLADMLGLDKDFLESSDGIAIMSGNGILEGTTPIAEAYAGHQFRPRNHPDDSHPVPRRTVFCAFVPHCGNHHPYRQPVRQRTQHAVLRGHSVGILGYLLSHSPLDCDSFRGNNDKAIAHQETTRSHFLTPTATPLEAIG